MPYKCNLDVSFNLPEGRVEYVDAAGKHCAIGKVIAGIAGRPLNKIDDTSIIRKLTNEMVASIGGVRFEDIWLLNDGTTGPNRPANHQQALRLALQYCLEAGFIELEDSELAVVRELKAIVQQNKEFTHAK